MANGTMMAKAAASQRNLREPSDGTVFLNELVMSCLPDRRVRIIRSEDTSDQLVPRFAVANSRLLCHKRSLHRPADLGLPWTMTVRVGSF
jgi:hypothetical protein